MRKLIYALALFALSSSPSFAELKIPSSVFTMEELEEAKSEAAEKEEPLVFVYTDPGTT